VAESCCREAGVRALHLEVGSENETARQLYSREGFALRRHTLMSKRI
jgi:ribosomal protein S18 acetylase RimI-like enzyme